MGFFRKRSKTPGPTINQDSTIENDTDLPLNYYDDQLPDIQQHLRQLNLTWNLERTLEKLDIPLSIALAGGALGFLMKRKVATASLFALGLAAQQIIKRKPLPLLGEDEKKELELERYALKAQRGDFGKLEVIPFR